MLSCQSGTQDDHIGGLGAISRRTSDALRKEAVIAVELESRDPRASTKAARGGTQTGRRVQVWPQQRVAE